MYNCMYQSVNVVLNEQYMYASVELKKKMIFLYSEKWHFVLPTSIFYFYSHFFFFKFYITGRNEWGVIEIKLKIKLFCILKPCAM